MLSTDSQQQSAEVMNGETRTIDLTGRARAFLWKPGAGIFIFLVVLLIVMGIGTPVMLSPGNLFGILNQMVFVLIPAFGPTLVIIAGGLDLSVGSVLGLTGGFCAFLSVHATAGRVRLGHSGGCIAGPHQWDGGHQV
jgi:ribose/xylose/arabinose/galactoside ABC-type transport system permease subunit